MKPREVVLDPRFEHYRAGLQPIGDSVCLLDTELRLALATKEIAAALLCRTQDLIGRPLPDLVPDLNDTRLLRTLRTVIEQGPSDRVVDQVRLPDGRSRWFDLTAHRIPEGLLCLYRDVTDRFETEDSLSHRLNLERALAACSSILLTRREDPNAVDAVLARLQAVSGADRVSVVVNRVSPDGVLRMRRAHEVCAGGVPPANDNTEELPYSEGLSRWHTELAQGNPILAHVEDMPEAEQAFLEKQGILSLLALPLFSGPRWRGFVGFEDTRSPRRWQRQDMLLLRTAAEMLGRHLAAVEAESLLEAERGQLLEIFDALDALVYVADTESYRILFVNRSLAQAVSGKLVGGLCYRVLQGREAPCPFCTNEQIRALRGGVYRWEHENPVLGRRFLLTDRLIRWSDGRSVRLEIAVDITERERLAERLRKAEKQESVGRLAGGVAHEFNNLLTAVIGYAELAAGTPDLPPEAAENLIEIKAAARRAAVLTQELLAYGRRGMLRPGQIELNGLLAEQKEMLCGLLGQNIGVEMSLTAEPTTITADEAGIRQVLVNLARNARDAMPDGGVLTLATDTACYAERQIVDGSTIEPGRYVRLVVKDNGVGMGESTLSRLFEPFFSTKQLGHGRGLGLAATYGIVRQSGGYINVESHPGEGTCFDILLPAKPPVTGAETVRARSRQRTPSVLLVEEDVLLRAGAAARLRSAGYRVVETGDGAVALDTLVARRGGRFDVLVTDMVVPGSSGPILAERARAIDPGTLVLIISAEAPERDSVAGHLPKPYTPRELVEAVSRLCEQNGERNQE